MERPLLKDLGKESIVSEICNIIELESEPGSKAQYCDLGYILLGQIVETVSGQHFDRFAKERIFNPLGMKNTFFKPKGRAKDYAATEFSNFRFEFVRGTVHDENAYAMDGVSGHAGLFSTARDLSLFCEMMLNDGKRGNETLLSKDTIRSATKLQNQDSYFGLGWWIKTPLTPRVGQKLSSSAFGHNGYTGTSIWMDPKKQVSIILLTNRVHPVREGDPDNASVGFMMKRRASWSEIQKSFHDSVISSLNRLF